jgi:hypothetical protein
VDLQVTVVVDEAQLPELVHEMADTRARSADDLGQRFLADRRRNRLRPALLAEVRQ